MDRAHLFAGELGSGLYHVVAVLAYECKVTCGISAAFVQLAGSKLVFEFKDLERNILTKIDVGLVDCVGVRWPAVLLLDAITQFLG